MAINNFKGDEGYNLAKAVMFQNISEIEKNYKRNPQVCYCEDSEFHYTVLHWAVGLQKYKAAKTLLELGMNPNIQSSVGGETPMHLATSLDFVDIEYMKLLLTYGANQ